MSKPDQDILPEIKRRLSAAFGERLKGVVLYGSQARGDDAEDSDIDVLVLLDGPAESWADVHRCSQALYALMLELERVIDAKPIDFRRYEEGLAPLYVRARREGIQA